MRLFVAINFDKSVKGALAGVMAGLRRSGASGRFTGVENLHITLSFLGEQPPERLPSLRRAMERAASPAFAIDIAGLGRFKRPDGDILWAGIRESVPLSKLHGCLSAALRQEGFSLDSRDFKPHLTLCRGFLPGEHGRLPELPAQTLPVDRLCLMRSDRREGELVYTEVFSQPLG